MQCAINTEMINESQRYFGFWKWSLFFWDGSLKCHFRFHSFFFFFSSRFGGTACTSLNTLQPLFYWHNIISARPEKGKKSRKAFNPRHFICKDTPNRLKDTSLRHDIQRRQNSSLEYSHSSVSERLTVQPLNLPVTNTGPYSTMSVTDKINKILICTMYRIVQPA